MKREETRRRIISTIQTLCILGGFMGVNYCLPEGKVAPWVGYFIPLFASLLVSFTLGVFLSVWIDAKSAAAISTPSTLMYIILYAGIPLVFWFDPFLFVGICNFLLPITLAGFVMNTLALWTGSLIHEKAFREKSPSSMNS